MKWFLPEDDAAGSKHGGRILKQNKELTRCVYCDSLFPLLIVEVHGLRWIHSSNYFSLYSLNMHHIQTYFKWKL